VRLDLDSVAQIQSRQRSKKRIADHEHEEQAALIEWADLAVKAHPELEMLAAVPNGGLRHPAVAAKLKKEGVRKGYPDLLLDVARAGFHGLRIEMKAGNNKTSAEQDDWLARLTAQGFCCYVAYSWTIAKDLILNYLRGSPTPGLIHKGAAA
jgi:hypothetical protein